MTTTAVLPRKDLFHLPDGLIYLVTRQDGNRTPNSGMVLRIEPVE